MLQFHPPKKVYGGRWAGVICILIKFFDCRLKILRFLNLIRFGQRLDNKLIWYLVSQKMIGLLNILVKNHEIYMTSFIDSS